MRKSIALVVTLTILLAGCAKFSADGGMDGVARDVGQETGKDVVKISTVEQAQRAIALVVQFSEGELAHKPDQQDVRRRLLLTVLDYYEDFLKEHIDDPSLQAGRERVESNQRLRRQGHHLLG